MTTPGKPSVLFVCVTNGGKSQMAAGLMSEAAGDTVTVDSAGTRPGDAINGLSAQVLLEVGADITDQTPQQLTDDPIAAATGSSFWGGTPRFDPLTAPSSNTGTPTNRPNTGSTASTACAWSATTSIDGFANSPTT
jgi:hypothetical protein